MIDVGCAMYGDDISSWQVLAYGALLQLPLGSRGLFLKLCNDCVASFGCIAIVGEPPSSKSMFMTSKKMDRSSSCYTAVARIYDLDIRRETARLIGHASIPALPLFWMSCQIDDS